MKLCLIPLSLVVVVMSGERVASADDDEPPKPLDSRTFAAWDHLELSMGFLGGVRDYRSTPFALEGSSASPAAASASEPFQHGPFRSVPVMGVRYDVRLVVSYVRMTAGFDLPFTAWSLSDGAGRYPIGGELHDVAVRDLSTKDLRFGIGAEYPFGPVAPFVDLLGSVHWVSTNLAIDGASADYHATTFAFSVRGGMRLHVRKWFFASASGEVGLIGDVKWGGDLSVGFAFL